MIPNNLVTFDTECYKNFWLIVMRNTTTGKQLAVDMFGESTTLTKEQKDKIRKIFNTYNTYGFNSNNYDIPVILYALSGASCYEIYTMSKDIITNKLMGWQTIKSYELEYPKTFNTFDIMPVATGMAGLKLYGARLHCPVLQELPYEFDTALTQHQADNVKAYCCNDIALNVLLFDRLKPQIELRYAMSVKTKLDLRSKGDAQISEAVFKSKLNAKHPPKTVKAFSYVAPEFIKFKSPKLNALKDMFENLRFTFDAKGDLIVPNEIKTARYLTSCGTTIQLGIGGVHSSESALTVRSDLDYELIDADVSSEYPSMILNCKLYPKHLDGIFLTVYKELVDERLEAKRNGDKVVDAAGKIIINSSFGKFGNKYSVLYAPDLLLQVTISCQLSMLMLIESLEECNIRVVSCNTDGVVAYVKSGQKASYGSCCLQWMVDTNLNLEYTRYKALYSRDVNNYFAVKLDGSVKLKGCFAESGLAKNPQGSIIFESVVKYLTQGIPIHVNIRACRDLTKFITVRKVKAGGVWKGEYIGSVCRWYYAKNGEAIHYKTSGNKVANSDGAKPIKVLTKELPKDIDYRKYIDMANDVLILIGSK